MIQNRIDHYASMLAALFPNRPSALRAFLDLTVAEQIAALPAHQWVGRGNWPAIGERALEILQKEGLS